MGQFTSSSCSEAPEPQPEIEVPGFLSSEKAGVGALVVRRHAGNNAPRVKIILDVQPRTKSVLLKVIREQLGDVELYTQMEDGDLLMFDGADNRFDPADLPKPLYVQGKTGSKVVGDVSIVLERVDDATIKEHCKFSVLWVEIEARHTGNVSPNNTGRTKLAGGLVPPADSNGLMLGGPYVLIAGTSGGVDVASAGFGFLSEFVGVVQPADFNPSGYGAKSDILGLKRQVDAARMYGSTPTIPVGLLDQRDNIDDTSQDNIRDNDPKPDGKIYDLDLPRIGFSGLVGQPQGAKVRYRSNFRWWASFGKVICSDEKLWFAQIAIVKNEFAWESTAGNVTPVTIDHSQFPTWQNDEYADGVIYIYDGPGAGQVRRITGNDKKTATIAEKWKDGSEPVKGQSKFLITPKDGWIEDPMAPAADNKNGDGTTILSWDLT